MENRTPDAYALQIEYRTEHRHIYETRLGILGFVGAPPAWAHNLAMQEASDHVEALKAQARAEAGESLRLFADNL